MTPDVVFSPLSLSGAAQAKLQKPNRPCTFAGQSVSPDCPNDMYHAPAAVVTQPITIYHVHPQYNVHEKDGNYRHVQMSILLHNIADAVCNCAMPRGHAQPLLPAISHVTVFTKTPSS